MGADVTWLAEPTTFVAVHLAKNNFTPSPTLAITDLEEADFNSYAALHAASAATQVFNDPGSGNQIVQVREPAGGWHWQTGSSASLPQTIYGFYLTSSDGDTLIGSERFPTPFVLTDTGDGVDIAEVRFAIGGVVMQ